MEKVCVTCVSMHTDKILEQDQNFIIQTQILFAGNPSLSFTQQYTHTYVWCIRVEPSQAHP